MTSTGWGAGRRTDRLSDGIKPLQVRERPPAAVPLLPLYRKTRVEGDYFIGGGAGPTCMKDLVVRSTTTHRKPPDVRICRLRNQSRVGTVPPSTSTPHCPACWARR